MKDILVFPACGDDMNPRQSSRLLFIHSGSDLYGASRSVLRLGSRLVKDGIAVLTVLPGDGPLLNALQEAGVSVQVMRGLAILERKRVETIWGIMSLLSSIIISTIRLLSLVWEFKPNVIHTMTAVLPSSGLTAKISGLPHIWHVRESFGDFGRWWKFYRHYMVWCSSRIICVSSAIAAQFSPGQRHIKVSVLNNGFPVAEFEQISPARISAFKERFSLENASVLIGVVGRIKYLRKGQEVFVEAARLLKDRYSDARFVCIGSPFPDNRSHLDDLLALIKKYDLDEYVICTGDVEDIKAAIAALDVLVLPSVQPEPFAGVIVEAMALSRPVVATRIGGSLEQVEDGVTGYLVDPGSAESLAAAVEKLILDGRGRKDFGANGRRRFLEKFEFEPFYQRMISLYTQLVPDFIGRGVEKAGEDVL